MQPSPPLQFRPFDPERDAMALLRDQVLSAGEQVRWTSTEGIRYYEVTERERNGDKSRRGSAWINPLLKIALKIIFFPITIFLAVWMSDATFPGGTRDDDVPFPWGGRKPPPTSLVFGSDPDCMAVIHPQGPTPGRVPGCGC